MRHAFLILFFCLSRCALANEWIYNYGVEGGVNLSSAKSADSTVLTGSRIGAVGGAYADLFPFNTLSLVPGFYIIGKGYRDSANSNQAVVLNYLQFRLLGRLSLFRNSASKFFIDFGPSAELISQKGTQNFPSAPDLGDVRNNDFSVMGGVGFETDIGSYARVVFNAKCHYGLLSVFNDSTTINGVTVQIPKSHSSGVFITLALQFSSEKFTTVPVGERAKTYIDSKSNQDLNP